MFDNAIPLSRPHFLWISGGGLGAIGLAWMLQCDNARAKRVVQVFCAAGVSHLETFDYKPELEWMHGKTLEAVRNRKAVKALLRYS